ncbi:reverse transcriptase domain-containing protein [Tanacetum coccineum]
MVRPPLLLSDSAERHIRMENALLVKIGDEVHSPRVDELHALSGHHSSNAIIGSGNKKNRAVPSQHTEMLKFPVEGVTDKHEIEPKEMHLRNAGRNVLRLQVSTHGLRACLEKADSVLSLPLGCIKEVQKQTETSASLNRILAKERFSAVLMRKRRQPCFSASKTVEKNFQAHTNRCDYKSIRYKCNVVKLGKYPGECDMKFEFEGYNIPYRPGPQSKDQICRFYCDTTKKNLRPNSVTNRKYYGAWTLCTGRLDSRLLNNEAEYEALIAVTALTSPKESGHSSVLRQSKNTRQKLQGISIILIHEVENKKADALSKIGEEEVKHMDDTHMRVPGKRNPSGGQKESQSGTSESGQWGIDIAGPFPEGPGKVKFLIVAIDYFTKWIEAKAVATITGNQVKKFVWDNIVCRFGLPGEIISDNGKQFRDNPFKDWCEKLCIRQCFASVKHPQANGLVERANRSLGEGIKARLDERSKD